MKKNDQIVINEKLVLIGNRIKTQRAYKKLSRETLSEMVNISSRFLAYIETGEQEMGIFTALELCKALEISPNYLLFDKNDWETNELTVLVQNCPPSKIEYITTIIQNCLKM